MNIYGIWSKGNIIWQQEFTIFFVNHSSEFGCQIYLRVSASKSLNFLGLLFRLRQISYLAENAVSIHMFKVNNENNKARCKISLKLAIKAPERRH